MRKIQNENLSQLLMQLKFAPVPKRRKQVDAAEKLLKIIEAEKEYPFEFICYHITGFRPKHAAGQELIKGSGLLEDLRIFIAKLSASAAVTIGETDEKVYTVEELAAEAQVSTKTVNRWRKRGLVARKFVLADGKKRLGILQSSVDGFLNKEPQIIQKAKQFRRLSAKEKKQIIAQACRLAGAANLSRYQVIEKISAQSGRAHETIRYTLNDYLKQHPEKEIFGKRSQAIGAAQAGEIFKLYKQKMRIAELMERFNRSRSSIYRLINQRRARLILGKKIEFVESEEFHEAGAEGGIGGQIVVAEGGKGVEREVLPITSSSFGRYLEMLKNIPPLKREREVELFRRYNFLKYSAFTARERLRGEKVSAEVLEKIESYIAEAERIQQKIIEANLRLVVAIASRHAGERGNLLDLVSEGNLSLMRAVEKFDYRRGFRFATYATWVIAKDYARKIPAEIARRARGTTEEMEQADRNRRTEATVGVVALERARGSLVQVIRENLDEREQYVIINHFGLEGSLIRKQRKTLQQIGADLNLTKERARQIELKALQKLRQLLSIEEFELLVD